MWNRALIGLVFSVTIGGSFPSFAEFASVGPNTPIDFDIPSQPLAKALLAYSAVTGLDVFYNAVLSEDRQSTAVLGILNSDAALQILLHGTHYVVRPTGAHAFMIVHATTGSAATAAQMRRNFEPYFAALQLRIGDVICRGSAAAESAEVLLQFWLSPSGIVTKAEEIGDDGRPAADQSQANLIRGLMIAAPPATMPQPVNIIIFPPSKALRGCGQANAPRRAG